jgi:predicted DNA-binding protein
MSNKYVSIRVKKETYKEMKKLALELELPITQLVDRIYENYMDTLSSFMLEEQAPPFDADPDGLNQKIG